MITMQFFHSFMVFLTWVAIVRLEDLSQTQFKAKASVSLGNSKIFSGEDVQLDCSVPDDLSPGWTFQWFRNGVKLSSDKTYNIKKAQVQQSGNYTCQGRKQVKIWPYTKTANYSDPLQLHVDGGWVLLQTTLEPLISDGPITLTCRIRDNPSLVNVIFYKGDLKIKTQNSKDLVFPNLNIEDKGEYSCRPTWVKNLRYQSAQSLPLYVNVLEKLETPRLVLGGDQEEVQNRNMVSIGTEVLFKCLTKVNTKEQDLTIEYYYMKDGNRLGPASDRNTFIISRVNEDDSGMYNCKVFIRSLNLERQSNVMQLIVLPF